MRHVHHLVQGRRDQAAEANDVHVALLGLVQDLVGRHHHTHVDHFIPVATQYHAHDILADVMHIAFHGGHQYPARGRLAGFFQFDKGSEHSHAFLHHARAFHHLGQEHLAAAEQVAHRIHAVHQRAFYDIEGPGVFLAGLFRIGLNKFRDPVDQRVAQSVLHRGAAPGFVLHLRLSLALHRFRETDELLRGIVFPVEDHVLAIFAQRGVDLIIDHQLPRVHDAHVHARADGVEQEHGVHGLPDLVIAAEREGEVADPAADLDQRVFFLHRARSPDEIHRVIVVLLHAGGHGEYVQVKDDVLRREAHLLGEDAVGPVHDGQPSVDVIGLPLFVKGHHDHCGAVIVACGRLLAELLLALFERDRVHDAFSLHAFEPRLDDAELRRIDHDRDPRDVRFALQQVEVGDHGLLAVQQRVIHVHVQHLRAALHLLAGHAKRLFV